MKRVNVFLTSLVGLVLVASSQIHAATIIASAQGDFVPGTTDGDTTPIAATGTGFWNYLGADTENPTLDGSLDFLEWSTASNRYQFTANGEPLVADGGTELLIHPGQNAPNWGVVRWTAGVGEGGLVNISGVFRKVDPGGTGVTGAMFLDGTLVPGSAVTLAGNNTIGESFDFDLTVSEGSLLDFVIGINGDSSSDGSGLNITITAIPEPSTLALLLVSGIGLLGYQHRQGQKLEQVQL